MKIWFLYRTRPSLAGEVSQFVLRATAPGKARNLAAANCGTEGPSVWLDEDESSCVHLKSTETAHFLVRVVE
jgi:hypothetical protein